MDIKYHRDDFLIIGDSFCANRHNKYSWPQQVLMHFTRKRFDSKIFPRGKGFPGGAWWSYRKVLLDELKIKTPKVLIVCHTEPYRLPNDNDLSLNFRSVETRLLAINSGSYKMPMNIATAADLYYKELFCSDFHDWANTQWFLEIDKICEEYNIEKIIHLYCFDGNYTKYTFKNGVTISTPLISYAEDPKKYFWRFKSANFNHYSPDGNILFAKKIIELIENYPGNNVRLNIKMINYESS
jgi:hypothetical protein